MPQSSFAVLKPGFTRHDASLFHHAEYLKTLTSPLVRPTPDAPFIAHHPAFLDLLGANPSLSVLAEDREGIPFAHEAPVWLDETKEVIFSANVLGKGGPNPFNVRSPIYRVKLETGEVTEVKTEPEIFMPNGAIRLGDKVLW